MLFRSLRCLVLLAGCMPLFSLAECTRLTASGNAEYPPYLWRSEADPQRLTGANVALLQRIGALAGIDIEVVYKGPWGRTQEELASGRIDLLAGAFYTRERADRMHYLYPAFQETRTLVWVNKARPLTFRSLDDLRGYQGVTVINNSFGQQFDDYAHAHLTIHQVGSLEQGFRMLMGKRVDYVVYEGQPGIAYMHKLHTGELLALPEPVSREPLYLTLSHKSACNTPELRQRLQEALRTAAREGWMAPLLEQAQQQWQARFPLP